MKKPNLEKLAKNVVKYMRIAQKPNPGVKLASKRYKFVKKLIKKKSIKLSSFSKKQQKIITEELTKFKYGPLVYKINNKYKVKTKVGEIVRLTYSETCPDCVELAKLIREESWRKGCTVAIIPTCDADSRKAYQILPEETLVELSPLAEMTARNIDVSLFVGYTADPNWSKGLDKKVLLSAPIHQHLHQITDRLKIRWAIVGLPVKRKTKDYVVPSRKYEKVFYDSLTASFKPETLRLCNYYMRALKGANKVRLTAKDGTDLTFSIKGRPPLVDDGIIDDADVKRGDVGVNIPCGEVFIAPLEHSANGKICFSYVFPSGFGLIKNLWVHFKQGKVVKYTADGDGAKRFKKFLASNTGEKDRIAELGIGTNKGADFIGAIFHFALLFQDHASNRPYPILTSTQTRS